MRNKLLLAVVGLVVVSSPATGQPEPPLPPGARARLGGTAFRHSGLVLGAHFLPDDKTLLTYADDGLVRLWEARTGKLVRALRLYQHKAEELAPFPVGIHGRCVFLAAS